MGLADNGLALMTIDDFLDLWHDDTPFVESHTSGSTGTPKLIRLPKADMRVSAEATNAFFDLGAGSVYVCPLAADYIAARMMAVRADIAGGQLAMLKPSNTFQYNDNGDLLAIVPSQVPHLLNAYPHSQFRNIIIGGASLSPELRNNLINKGFNAYESYGMTETCSHVALRHVNNDYFSAMPNITFATDARGCLVINAPRYSFKSLISNDIVHLVDNHHFVWLGRADNVINSGGIKIHPEQLEAELHDIITVPFYIESIPDAKWGAVPGLVIEGRYIPDLNAIRRRVGARRAPRTYRNVPALPRTSNGKLKR